MVMAQNSPPLRRAPMNDTKMPVNGIKFRAQMSRSKFAFRPSPGGLVPPAQGWATRLRAGVSSCLPQWAVNEAGAIGTPAKSFRRLAKEGTRVGP